MNEHYFEDGEYIQKENYNELAWIDQALEDNYEYRVNQFYDDCPYDYEGECEEIEE